MELGVIFPQREIGNDPVVIRTYAQGVEAAGFGTLGAYDHVLGASADRPGGWSGRYTDQDAFHEVFVLLGYLAAVTSRLVLSTEVLVLPQRQTALVAKQAAEVDVLSGGRLRLGVGLGWNAVEYEALGMTFTDRGRRLGEQVAVLRRLWAEGVVTVEGRDHRIHAAGLNPLPSARRIPIWFGGRADAALRRAAELADGWIANVPLGPELDRALAVLRAGLRDHQRDLSAFGLAGRVTVDDDPAAALTELRAWEALGATDCALNTMDAGVTAPLQHLERLIRVKRQWDGG
ncbi:MAG TPA: LLM class F420-dependent oxidoreductase [Candidatus Micrarchaeia archaeon]|nr:LLM class F420-dependent oxidoreductase [Candidatus Micrarchaeia archaeon]